MRTTLEMIAAILAGGQSRRMGQDKTFLEVDGVPMIERVIKAIKPSAPEIVIIANDPEERLMNLGFPVYEDSIRGMGPLSGLYTAFEMTQAESLLLAACDMPWIKPEIIELLVSYPNWKTDALIPVAGGREQGLLAVYRRRAVEKVRDRIIKMDMQFDEFRQTLDKTLIDEKELRRLDSDLSSFRNVNRPDDLS